MAKIVNAYPDIERDLSFYPVRNEHPRFLTREQIRQFNEKGYVFPLDVFTAEEADANRAYFNEIMAKAEAKGWNSYSINGWQLRCPGIYDLIENQRIADYVSDLHGENLICWGAHYFCKTPGDTKRVSWHQDASYWPLTPSKTITVWLAIDDASVENGAMKVIPGSHLHGQLPFEESTVEEQNVLNQSVNDPLDYGDEPVSIELKAGQISLHTDLLLHGSEPNPSTKRRCGLTMRFVSPDVRALKGWNKNGIVVRGSGGEHWVDNPRPEREEIPEKPK